LYSKLIDHLFVDHRVQLAIIPEFISFLAGRKNIIRIVNDNPDIPFKDDLFNQEGFHVSTSTLYCVDHGNFFGELQNTKEEITSQSYSEVKMYSISRSIDYLKEFESAELYGDIEKAGHLLGYPSCCTKNIHNINSQKEQWALYYLNDFKTHSKAIHDTNRFPISWGGISPIGELFPCSLICKSAIEYSKNMKTDLLKLGLLRIAEMRDSHSKKSIYINSSTGEISFYNKVGYEEIKFY
jgi:hypothetical protein